MPEGENALDKEALFEGGHPQEYGYGPVISGATPVHPGVNIVSKINRRA